MSQFYRLFAISVSALLLTTPIYAADPNIVECPNSISPAIVTQWSTPSFSIILKNSGDEDIRLDPNTKLRFGLGTGHPYTNMAINAIDENLCWVNLTGGLVIPAGTRGTLVFEEALICGELPADIYLPQLELTGTYVNSGAPFSLTFYTQTNPITVTYYDRQWANSCGLSSGGVKEFLFTPDGGYCQYSHLSRELPSSRGFGLARWADSN